MRKDLIVTSAFLLGCLILAANSGYAVQSQPKKSSIWQRIKDAAKQAEQPNAQPQPSSDNGKKTAPKQPAASQQPAHSQSQVAQSGLKSSAKVDSQDLLTGDSGGHYAISPKGLHLAAIVMRGSRQVLVYDGGDGPKFDEIVGGNSSSFVVFSPDGARYSYVGRSGQEYVYMVDGKEVARFPIASMQTPNVQIMDANSGSSSVPLFTSNSRHYYYEVVTHPGDGNEISMFYFDGKPASTTPPNYNDPPVFSPNGEHYAFVTKDRLHPEHWWLIVDGKPAPWQGGSPQFTGDSKHLITSVTTSLRSARGFTPVTEVQLDGKPWFRAPEVTGIYPDPSGQHIAAAVGSGPPENHRFLLMDGKKVAGSDSGAIYGVFFTQDGKHWAAHCATTGTQGHFMILDGKKGLEYQSVTAIGFSSDGRLVYSAQVNAGKSLIVHGDEESELYGRINPSLLQPSSQPALEPQPGPPDALIIGSHFAFATSTQTDNQGSVIIDGKPIPILVQKFTFSPDGSRNAYGYHVDRRPYVAVDGVQHRDVFFQEKGQLIFSPDGKHVAYAASSIDHQTIGISLDGKYIPSAGEFGNTDFPVRNLSFTPDSRHLLWTDHSLGRGYTVFIDGLAAFRVGSGAPPILSDATGAEIPDARLWSIAPDGTLSFIADDGQAVKRISISPPADTSLDTLAAMTAGH